MPQGYVRREVLQPVDDVLRVQVGVTARHHPQQVRQHAVAVQSAQRRDQVHVAVVERFQNRVDFRLEVVLRDMRLGEA